MYPRFAFTLLFSVCAFGFGTAIPAFPVDDRCGANAVFLDCGSACVADCKNPQPAKICSLQCVTGCFCKEGYLKNEKGECVRPSECDGQTHHKLPIQIPSAPSFPTNQENAMLFAFPPEMQQCKENEMFMGCGSACVPTCANPHPTPACTRQCVAGCFCKPGYLKNEQGLCVQSENCGVPAAEAMPFEPQVCAENEEFRQCKGCDGTCDNPHPICPRICIPGCACKQGHLRSGQNGKCIKAEQCPKVDSIQMLTMPRAKCAANEVFRACGTACPATCAKPHPGTVCTKNCVIGCFCQEGYLKNAQGVCVPAANCDTPKVPETKCASDREMFLDDCGSQMDCMAACNSPPVFLIHGVPQISKKCMERKCAPSCVCKYPYVRNTDGKCVERKQCHA